MKIPTPFPVAFYEIGLLAIILIAIASGYLWDFMTRLEAGQLFNLFEGLLWTAIGLIFTWRALRKTKYRALQIGSSVSFILFGISDFIEMRTGAWDTPWTLFALKAACVLSFLIHLRFYINTKKNNS